MITYQELLEQGTKQLQEAGITQANLDAWYLLESVANISRVWYFMHSMEEVKAEDVCAYQEKISARAKRIPLQHILGTQEFMGLPFFVNEHVLIPRSDTECLVEEVLPYVKNKKVLDVCTGSGCIVLSLAKLGKPSEATGVDISTEALKVARLNAKELGVSVQLLESDLFEQVTGTFDVIVSNPPYIRTKDISNLEPEVKDHDPILALDGKEDGLYFYHKIIAKAKDYLNPDGHIFFEIGYDQAGDVSEILKEYGFNNIQVKKDLTGLDRIVSASMF